jgi:xylan 1,4-beta-xylosidase
MTTFFNPILTGFHPDPSICRAGEDYYLTCSTFEYFPGLPIYHSRDLVHWNQIGNALERPEQLPLDGVASSEGIYAPTIRFHQNLFYIVTTNVTRGGNFIVTAENPAGPWSDPHWLDESEDGIHAHFMPNAPGIDPSLFFDLDGRCWYTGNRITTAETRFTGERVIWIQELDLSKMQLIGKPKVIFCGEKNHFTEGPHLYKRGDFYYLIVADGGTGHDHSVLVARSKTVDGVYELSVRNPILTHRHLGHSYPIVNIGHADLVETQNGEWWLACLGSRPYGGYFRNLGRETFLAPVIWEEDWPVVSPGTGKVEMEVDAPRLAPFLFPDREDESNGFLPKLGPEWLMIRTPKVQFVDLDSRPGWARVRSLGSDLAGGGPAAFLGKRQRHFSFKSGTMLDLENSNRCIEAGMALYLNDQNHFLLSVKKIEAGTEALLSIVVKGKVSEIARRQISGTEIQMEICAHEQDIQFFAGSSSQSPVPVGPAQNGRHLSPDEGESYTGVVIGLFAVQKYSPESSSVDFKRFSYREI